MLLVVRHAFVLFLIFFIGDLFLSVDFFLFIYLFHVSPLSHLNFRCLSVESLIEPVVFPHSFISVGGRHPVGVQLRELLLCGHSAEQFDPLCPVCCGGHSLWSFFWKLHYPFFPYTKHSRGFYLTPELPWTISPIGILFFAVRFHGKGNTAPFQQCGSALLILRCKWIWRVTMRLWPVVVLDRTGPNCGREAWAEECAERDSGILWENIKCTLSVIWLCSSVFFTANYNVSMLLSV